MAKLQKSLQKALKSQKIANKAVVTAKEGSPAPGPVTETTRGKKVKKASSGGKKGKKFVDNAAMLKLISEINAQHETHVSAKQTAEQLKREALLAHQKRQEEAREARKDRKEQRLSELKQRVREQKHKLEEKEKGMKKGKGGSGNKNGEQPKGKPNKKGKRVTFAS